MYFHHRLSNRLKNFDYSSNRKYFITICVKNRQCCFGDVVDFEMKLNQWGMIVKKQWLWISQQYPYVLSDEYIIMPNHFHGIIGINNGYHVGTGRDLSLHTLKIKSLPEIIGAFKTTSSKIIHQHGFYDFQWQRSYYDHIIRTDRALNKIRLYIQNNPAKWTEDRNNLIYLDKQKNVKV